MYSGFKKHSKALYRVSLITVGTCITAIGTLSLNLDSKTQGIGGRRVVGGSEDFVDDEISQRKLAKEVAQEPLIPFGGIPEYGLSATLCSPIPRGGVDHGYLPTVNCDPHH